jgi:hypothetical protein
VKIAFIFMAGPSWRIQRHSRPEPVIGSQVEPIFGRIKAKISKQITEPGCPVSHQLDAKVETFTASILLSISPNILYLCSGPERHPVKGHSGQSYVLLTSQLA